MYEKPKVARFGTLRELTKVGTNLTSDGRTLQGNVGNNCQVNMGGGPSDLICPRS